MKRRVTLTVGLLIAAAVLAACGTTPAPVTEPRALPVPTFSATSGSDVAKAKQVIKTITVKGRAAKTGYSREKFGDGWATVRGCDMRDRVLARDLVHEKLRSDRCTVTSGDYPREPYSGVVLFHFVKGGTFAHALDIDHVYSLSLAWQQGAWRWSDAKREKFANDPENLVAASARLNRQKGDSGPASWLPPARASWCEYVVTFTLVAGKYELSMNPADHDRIEQILKGC